jgi:ribosomal protein S18 acetylase RimI-like enzyme
MSISDSISRLTSYYRLHGLTATLHRVRLAGTHALLAGRMVVLYCDLDERKLPPVSVPDTLRVQRITAKTELSVEHLQSMTNFWNPKLASRDIQERFERGASLWLVECEARLAGYGWTLRGQTIAPYYFPLGPDDVQLFDFYVFPRFRGRALHWLLTGHILHTLAAEGGSRAFADTGEWNQAQLASFTMTPFRILGLVRKYRIWGQLLTCWVESAAAGWERRGATRGNRTMKMRRSNE